MASIADLFITVSSDVTGAMSGLTAVDTKLNGTSTSMASATAAALPLAAAAGAIGAGFLGAIETAASFEAQISGIKAVLAPDEVEVYGQAIEDLALALGRDTVFSASQAANAIEELVKAGVPIETVLNGGAAAATSLAAATGFDLARSAEFAGTALNTFHIGADQLDDVVNHLSGTVNASAADMGGLQFAFAAVGPVAAGLGLTFNDTATALGVFADNGLKGSDAGTSLKTMLLNLQPTTKSQVAAFQELGLYTVDVDKGMQILTATLSQTEAGQKVLTKAQSDGVVTFEELFKAANALSPKLVDGAKDSDAYARAMGLTSNAFFDAAGNAKPLNEIFGILKTSTEGLTNQQKLLLLEMAFGADAVRAASIAASEGAEGFNELAANIDKISAADAAKTRLDNLKGSLDQMGGSFEAVQIKIGQMFLPAIRSLIDFLTLLLNGFLSLPEPVQQLLTALTGITGVVAGLTAAFILLSPVVTAMAVAFGVIAAAAAPIILPILAIVAAVAALKLAWDTDFAGIQGVTAEVWTTLQPLFENIRSLFSQLVTAAQPVADSFMNQIVPALKAFSDAIAPLLAQLPNLIRTIGDFWNAVSAIIQLLNSGDFSGAWDTFVGAVWIAGQNIGEAFGNIVTFIGDQLGQVIPTLIASLPDPWEPFVTSAWEIGTRIAEAFGNFMVFIGQAIAAIPALITGSGDPWEAFIAGAWEIGTRIAEAFGNFLVFIGQSIASIPNLVAGQGDVWEGFITAVWNIGARVAEAWGNVFSFIGEAIGGIPGLIDSLGDIFGPLANAAWALGERIGDAIMNAIGFIGEAIGGIPAMLEGMGDIFGGIVSAAGGLYDRIAAAIEPIKQLLSNTFGSFWQWLTGAVSVPDAGGTTGGATGGTTGGTISPAGPIVAIGTLIISSQAEADAFLQQVADAVLASARRVSPPLTGANPAL